MKKYWTVAPDGKHLVTPNGKEVPYRVQQRKQLQLDGHKVKRTGPPEWLVTIAWGTHSTKEEIFYSEAAKNEYLASLI
jgi:hypothetical protein